MVSYFTQDTSFVFKYKRLNSNWLKQVCANEGKKLGAVSVIFCSDKYLLGVNIKYLGHDYYTDIITFDYCEGACVSGDLFISVDSVKENSVFYKTCFEDELNRVIVHGVLHLIGYDDHTEPDVAMMRSKEDQYLELRKTLL
ncbi:MAG: rRNA maturation RNase YbeY [Bacteroidales bacterium]|nr:rRNA maturation RNase YbeY [Bacteroidales bacterium]